MSSPIARHLGDQFRRPRGPLGRVAGRIMAQRSSNVERSRWTVERLELNTDARVLELGYGPGLGIEAALQRWQDRIGINLRCARAEGLLCSGDKRLWRDVDVFIFLLGRGFGEGRPDLFQNRVEDVFVKELIK